MTIEEKAKAYDEALERAKEMIKAMTNVGGVAKVDDIQHIFPELKESEDERMLRVLREGFNILDKDDEWYSGITNGQIFAWLEKKGEQKPVGKVEPKFKIKYAGSEYNVLEVKDIAGVTYYGIEDKPNHIDYVQAENCERVDGYSIKESGSPFPTKPAKFSEQNSAWSEEDEKIYQFIIDDTVQENQLDGKQTDWLKFLKNRITYKPTGAQLASLEIACDRNDRIGFDLMQLLKDLKKL